MPVQHAAQMLSGDHLGMLALCLHVLHLHDMEECTLQDLHVSEYVLSNELVSMALAMVAESPAVNVILAELFTVDGNELYIHQAARYLRYVPHCQGLPPAQESFQAASGCSSVNGAPLMVLLV